MFLIIEKSEETTFEFTKFCEHHKMETQKIINLMNDSSNEESKFAKKKKKKKKKNGMLQTVKQQKGKYNQNKSVKPETESIKSGFCDYSDAFILVTGDITVTANNNADVAFLHVKQNLMMYLLIKQIIFTLQYLCRI